MLFDILYAAHVEIFKKTLKKPKCAESNLTKSKMFKRTHCNIFNTNSL